MQLAVSALRTQERTTVPEVAEKVEKPREIPPNAAPRSEIDRVRARVAALGFEWHDAVSKAGIARNTGYTLLRGIASVGTLRKLEEWVVKQEHARGAKPARAASEDEKDVEAWAELGRELLELDPDGFKARLDGLRQFVKAQKDQEAAIRKMFRATPEE
jgi:hypothetical protein